MQKCVGTVALGSAIALPTVCRVSGANISLFMYICLLVAMWSTRTKVNAYVGI